jgi:hypothetical protein
MRRYGMTRRDFPPTLGQLVDGTPIPMSEGSFTKLLIIVVVGNQDPSNALVVVLDGMEISEVKATC